MADNDYKELTDKLDSTRRDLTEALDSVSTLQERLRKAHEFKDGQYADLIAELFTKPKDELVRSMRSWAAMGLLATVLVTTCAIGVSMWVASGTSRELQDLSRDLAATAENVEVHLGILSLSTEGVTKIATILAELRDKFSSYESGNDVALAYTVDLVSKAGPEHYMFYLGAFKSSGIDDDALPSQRDLRDWDQEAARLYARWLQALDGRTGEVPKESSGRRFATFAASGKVPQYGHVENK